jgi:surfactin synthase thioesterase subunit
MRLFCLPHAGGGATAFRSWTAELPAFVQLCPVQLPGRETRLSEALCTHMDPLVEAMDRELRPWLDIPYAVFGHSMGALLAFEWVRKLQRERSSLPAWLFLSGRRAPDTLGDAALPDELSDRELNSAGVSGE